MGGRRDGGRAGARVLAPCRRRPAGGRLRASGPGGDAGDARLLGRPTAQLSIPGRRGHVLVRGAGAYRRPRLSGDREGADRRPPAARPGRSLPRRLPRDPCRARLRRHPLAVAHRPPDLARLHGSPGRALHGFGRPALRRQPRLRLPGTAPDVARLREVRDRDVRRLPHARDERGRLLPLHADAARHADRVRRLGARGRRGDDLRGRLRGSGDGPPSSSRESPPTSPTSTRRGCRS